MSAERPALVVTPPAILTDPALGAVFDALPEARLVGGAVRDVLLGQAVADVDLATPRRPEEVMLALAQAGLRTVPTGIKHGTVTAIYDGRTVEITTLRRDVSTDGRHAVVAFTDAWREDAARRDFTINAMSMTREGGVFDYFGGVDDLRAGRVRFVGDPATRIAEDYLRVLRFFRFVARYGRGEPDAPALAAIRGAVPGLARLSAERVWSELKRILAAPDPRTAIDLMAQTEVLDAVLPGGADVPRFSRLIEAGAPMDPMLRLAGLVSGDTSGTADRLKLSGAEREFLLALRSGTVPRPADDDAALRRMLALESREILIGRAWLATADDEPSEWPAWAALRARIASLPQPVFPLAGRDVLLLGVPQGPRVGQILSELHDWWLAGGCTADEASCRAELLARLCRQA